MAYSAHSIFLPDTQDAGDRQAPRFAACRVEDYMRSGFHVGRRLDWTDPGRSEIVWIDVQEHEGNWFVGVHRCGSRTVEDHREWQFDFRVAGIRPLPEGDETIDLIEGANETWLVH